MEELHEFEEAWAGGDPLRMEDELGDLLFSIVNLGRFLSLNPEEALRKTINRFQKRFSFVEDTLHGRGLQIQDTSFEELDQLWEQAKNEENSRKDKDVTAM